MENNNVKTKIVFGKKIWMGKFCCRSAVFLRSHTHLETR